MESDRLTQVTLAGRSLGDERHVCAFFNSEDEEFDALLPFVREGIAQGEKAFHIVNPDGRDEYIRRLNRGGVEVDDTERTGQIEVRVWEEVYLKPGYFDQSAMLELIQEVLKAGRTQGYPITRFVAQMEWCLRDCSGVEDIVEYESRLNYVLPQHEDVVICTYDIAKHSSEVIMGVLRTHPAVVIGGTMQLNPFYVSPDEFLIELRARKAMAGSGL